MIFNFDEQLLFGNPTYRLMTPAQREFSAKDTSCNRQYIEHRHDYLSLHNYDARMTRLQTDWNVKAAEKLDQDHQRACKYAAGKCQKKPNIAYVKTISDLRKKKNVLLKVISESKLSISLSEAIANQVKEGHNFRLPQEIPECVKLLRTTRKQIRMMEKDAVTHRANEQETLLREATAKGDN